MAMLQSKSKVSFVPHDSLCLYVSSLNVRRFLIIGLVHLHHLFEDLFKIVF